LRTHLQPTALVLVLEFTHTSKQVTLVFFAEAFFLVDREKNMGKNVSAQRDKYMEKEIKIKRTE
jgi:hypothetical protein